MTAVLLVLGLLGLTRPSGTTGDILVHPCGTLSHSCKVYCPFATRIWGKRPGAAPERQGHAYARRHRAFE